MRPLTALLCASLLAAGLGAALAVPLKTPTPRKGDCFNKMKGEIVASDQPGKVGQGQGAPGFCERPPPVPTPAPLPPRDPAG